MGLILPAYHLFEQWVLTAAGGRQPWAVTVAGGKTGDIKEMYIGKQEEGSFHLVKGLPNILGKVMGSLTVEKKWEAVALDTKFKNEAYL